MLVRRAANAEELVDGGDAPERCRLPLGALVGESHHPARGGTGSAAATAAAPERDGAWTGLLEEREELIHFWDSLGKPVFVLTGDLHNSFAVNASAGGLPVLRWSRGRPAVRRVDPRWSQPVQRDGTSR